MADTFSINERVTDTTGWYACWKLVRTLITAGWTVVQSGNGTSFGASDYWTVYASTGSGSWIVLSGPGSRHLCFWRDTGGSTANGKIIYVPSGQSGFTFASASATSPGTIPTSAQYMRGAAGTFNSWFGGSTNAIRWLSIGAKDVSDGSFWINGSSPTAGTNYTYHCLGFFSLYSADAGDPDPYLWYCSAIGPTSDTSASSNGYLGEGFLLDTENAASTGYWWGWSRASTWRTYRPGIPTTILAGPARDPYTPGYSYVMESIALGKTESGYTEMKGYVKWARAVGNNDNRGITYSEGSTPFKWVCIGAMFGSNVAAVVFWDGVTPAMAFEY